MYSLIIVDDEKIFIQDICDCLDFDELNIKLTATANNGQDGLDKITALMPDIILCDVDMPIMNGLEMLEKVAELPDYNPQIILLTAHDTFSYAKKAISLRVMDYIVKPCLPDDLISALTMAKKLCDELRHKNSMIFSYAELQIMKFINDIIHKNQYSQIDLLKQQFDLGISLKAKSYTLLRIQFVPKTTIDISEEIQLAKQKINDMLINSFVNGFNTNYSSNHFYFLLSDMADKKITTDICQNILDNFTHKKYNVYISVSDYCASVSELPTLLDQVKYCNKFSFCFESNKVLSYSVINDYVQTTFNSKEFHSRENDLKNIASIGLLNPEHYLDSIKTFAQSFVYYDPEYFKNLIYKTIISMLSSPDNIGEENEIDEKSGIWIDILKTHSLSQLLDLCMSIVSKFDGSENSVEFRNYAISNYIKNYVYANYMNSCSTDDIARSLYISERRARDYFLHVNGISISDFVRNVRMQKALELIKTSKYKIQEVTEMVGYDTEHRFRDAFTKYYGNPPSHYMKK